MAGVPGQQRDRDYAVLSNTTVDIHQASRRSYGPPGVHVGCAWAGAAAAAAGGSSG